MTEEEILQENDARNSIFNTAFNPLSGEGAPLSRFRLHLSDYSIPLQWLPYTMKDIPLIALLLESGSIENAIIHIGTKYTGNREARKTMIQEFIKLRIQHDFCYWAYCYVNIKDKNGGGNIPFTLNHPQRKVLTELEKMRIAGLPIRMILLKARQWGGSTLIQMYMAWIQLVHREGFYSAIVAHLSGASKTIRAMYSKMIKEYPPRLLGCDTPGQLSLTPYEGSHNDVIISQKGKVVRDNVICIGSMQTPDSIRGGDIALAHLSEVGLWKETLGKSPEDVIRSVSSSIMYAPLTMDVMESTANGEHNLFHNEWIAAKRGESLRVPVFVAWFEIERYSIPFRNPDEKALFARELIQNKEYREVASHREEPGAYLWYLWTSGASLESINWYVNVRRGYNSHHAMASEYPSDDIEAFKHSGESVFDKYSVETLRATCRPPVAIGEIAGCQPSGKQALAGLTFYESEQGLMRIWEYPATDIKVSDRYITVTDVGGKSSKSDYSCILVIDRYWLTQGEGPVIAAEWHGHLRHDLLAWKMAQIAAFYNNSLLVVESNTYETRDKDRYTEGDHTEYILDQIASVYSNLYARPASSSPRQSIAEPSPTRWGFQTNINTKPLIIDNLIKHIEDNLYTEREEQALEEYNAYEKKPDGTLGAAKGTHDDRLMARAIGLYISTTMPLPRIIEKSASPKLHHKPISEATM